LHQKGALNKRSDFNKLFGAYIRQLRKDKGLSLRKMEELADYQFDRHTLSRIENGRISPTIYTLFKISQVLKIDFRDVLKNFPRVKS